MSFHVYAPKPDNISFRILPKGYRIFKGEFKTMRDAFESGLKEWMEGFRVFKQLTYEWHEPTNIELIKVGNIIGENK